MKAYEKLSRMERMYRLRQLAQVALEAFDLTDFRFWLLRDDANTLFRVKAGHVAKKPQNDLFLADHYLLRIHHHSYRTVEGINLELAWLMALRREIDAPVPEPVPARDGRLVVTTSVPGIPGQRTCSLFRWVKGRSYKSSINPHHYRLQGQLMGLLHNHAAQWNYKDDNVRRYDWRGLFRDDTGVGISASHVLPLLPTKRRKNFEHVAEQIRKITDRWGKGTNVYGVIHADLGVDANLLFWREKARAIDFDDCGPGYWIFDLAIALEHLYGSEVYSMNRAALLEGYADIRSLPKEQTDHLELFLAAYRVYWCLHAAAIIHLHPQYRQYLNDRIERYSNSVNNFLNQ